MMTLLLPWTTQLFGNTVLLVASRRDYYLVETLTQSILEELKRLPRITSLKIEVIKPNILTGCLRKFPELEADEALVQAYQTEDQLFQSVERQVCQNQVSDRLFKGIDDFIKTAASIMNRRKARAGRSFENHVEYLLTHAKVPHKMRPALGADGRPDIVIPDARAYFDTTFALDKLFIVGLETTCKDRWRPVLNEGLRVPAKHILTLQAGHHQSPACGDARGASIASCSKIAAQKFADHQSSQRGELHPDGEAAA